MECNSVNWPGAVGLIACLLFIFFFVKMLLKD